MFLRKLSSNSVSVFGVKSNFKEYYLNSSKSKRFDSMKTSICLLIQEILTSFYWWTVKVFRQTNIFWLPNRGTSRHFYSVRILLRQINEKFRYKKVQRKHSCKSKDIWLEHCIGIFSTDEHIQIDWTLFAGCKIFDSFTHKSFANLRLCQAAQKQGSRS